MGKQDPLKLDKSGKLNQRQFTAVVGTEALTLYFLHRPKSIARAPVASPATELDRLLTASEYQSWRIGFPIVVGWPNPVRSQSKTKRDQRFFKFFEMF